MSQLKHEEGPLKQIYPMTRIGLVQMRCEKGAIKKNLDTMAWYLEEAELRGMEFMGFPEMNLTGYADPAQYPEAVIRPEGSEVQQLLDLTQRYSGTVLAGIIEANPLGKPFITQIAIQQGVIQGYYRKITIKDEETKWFSPGQNVPVFQSKGFTFGMAICADIGNEDVFAECARQGAKIVFELAAPGLYGEQATRNWQSGFEWWQTECQRYLSCYTQKHGLWVAVATQAGRTVDEDFPGGGFIYSPEGECVYATTDGLPGAVYLELDFQTRQVVRL
jgi:predicted amidohydrolase